MRTAKFYRVTFVTVLLLLAFVLTAGILSDGGRLVPVGDVTSSVAPEEVTATSDDAAFSSASATSSAPKADGEVADDYQGSGTATTDINEIRDNPSGSYRLNGPMTVSSLDTGTDFTGVLDGCGNTITIKASASGGLRAGGLFATLKGTVKNVKIIVEQFSFSTTNAGYREVGIIAGSLDGGTIENVSVELRYSPSENNPPNVKGDWGAYFSDEAQHSGATLYNYVGGFAGSSTGNSTIKFSTFYNNTAASGNGFCMHVINGSSTFTTGTSNTGFGGFVGCVTGGSLAMTNNRFNSASDSKFGAYYYQAKSNIYSYSGLIVGYVLSSAEVKINGLIYDYVPSFDNLITDGNADTNVTGGHSVFPTFDVHFGSAFGQFDGSAEMVDIYAPSSMDWLDGDGNSINGGVILTENGKVVAFDKNNANNVIVKTTYNTPGSSSLKAFASVAGTSTFILDAVMATDANGMQENDTAYVSVAKSGKSPQASTQSVTFTNAGSGTISVESFTEERAEGYYSSRIYDGNNVASSRTLTLSNATTFPNAYTVQSIDKVAGTYTYEFKGVGSSYTVVRYNNVAYIYDQNGTVYSPNLVNGITVDIEKDQIVEILPLDAVVSATGSVTYGQTSEELKDTVEPAVSELVSGDYIADFEVTGYTQFAQNAGTAVTVGFNLTIKDAAGKDVTSSYAVTGSAEFTVQQKDVTVTASNAEKQFGEENPAFDCQVTVGEFYEDIEEFFTCVATATSNAGETFDIEPSVSVVGGDNGNYNITYVKGTLTVVPREVTIGLSDDSAASVIEYPGLGVVPNAELLKLFLAPKDIDGQPLFLNFSVTKDGEEATALYAGEYTVTASLPKSYMNDEGKTVSQANYTADSVEASLTVKAKEIEVTASGAETEKVYDGIAVDEDTLRGLFFTDDIYEEGGEVVLVVSVVEGEVKNVGSYTVTVSLEEGAERMYAISDTSVKSVTYTVNAKAISVNWSESAFVYNGTEQKPEASAVDVIVGDTVNVSVTVKEGEAINAGSYTAVAASDNANYTFTHAEKVFKIARASLDGLSVTIDGWTYGDEAATPEVVGNVENGDVTYLYKSTDGKGYSAAVAPTAAGEYKLTVTVAATANYEAGSADCAFTVAKKLIAKPTANEVQFVYTGAEQTYLPVGFDESTMTVEGNKQTDVQEGGYVVTVALADAANFEWADGTSEALTFGFVIGKASLTDSTVDAVADYDGAAHGISVALDGFVGGENIESAGGNVKYSANGTDGWSAENIAVTDVTEGEVTVFYRVTFANYATVESSATVTVRPKNITIKGVTAVEREYDGTTTVPLAGGNLVGVVVDDEVTFEAGTGTLESADAGEGKTVSTAIVLTGADAGNYVLAQPAVTVNIVRKTVTIDVVEAGVAREYDKDTVTTDYATLFTAPNGVVGEDGELALVFGVVAEGLPVEDGIKVVGVYTVTANLADADGNYTAAEATVTYTVTVKKITEPSFTAPELTYNGTPQSVTITEDAYYTVGGKTSATDAGDYVATVSLVDNVNTSWTDGGTDALEFPWSIAKATPTVYVVVTLPEGGLFASDEELPSIAVDAEQTSVAGSVAWDGGQSLVAGTKVYGWTFTPEDATNYNVVVGGEELTVNAVEIVGIAVTAEPDKKVYEYGDEFDKTGMEVTVQYNNGATKAVVDFEVSVLTFDTLGEVSVTVTYEGKTASVTVTVNVRKIDKPQPSIPSLTYSGVAQGITINEDAYYVVGGMTSATDAGDYVATVSLVDNVNTSWADGSTDNLEFSWSIAKATPTVTPAVVFDGTLYTSDDLPAIATTDGDTAGTIAWAEGQSLVAGTRRYNWIFVPTDSDNYTEITGTYELSAVAVAVESIEVTRNPDKVVYEYGDGFDNAGMVVTASYNNGEQSAIDGYSVMPETFDVIGDSISVTVTYEGKTCSVTVQVVKKVVTIDGVAAVTREYDGTAEVTLEGGPLVGIVGDDEVTFELGKGLLEDPNAGDNKAVTTSITLGGADADKYTLAQPTDVKAVIKQAKSTVNPVVSYEGVIYTSSAFPSITLSEGDTEGTIKWDDGQSLVAGEHEYFWTFIPADAVNYETVNDTYVLTVEAVVLEGIEVTFDAGDDLIYASTSVDSLRQYLTVTGVNNDGTPYEGTIEYTLSGIIKAGDCVITVTVVGTQISDTFTVAVVGTSVTGIEISAQPAKTQYTAFEDFDKTGMVVVAVYADGNRKPVTDYEIEGGTDLRVGTDKVTVVFNEFSQEVSITVSPVKVAKPAPAINPFVYNGTEQGIEISQSEYYSVSGMTSATDAGDYSARVTLRDVDNTEWADGSTAALEFAWSIAKADYDMSGITFGDDTVEYDGKEHNLRIDGTLPTGLDGITLSVEYSAGIKDAGSVTVTATFVTASVNYNVSAPLTATLTVTAKTLQVVWLNYVGLVYNGKAQAPMATVKTGVQGETVRLIVEGAQTAAGENYVATAVMETPSVNYILTNTTVEFSIGKATPDYSVPDNLEIAQGQDLEDVVLPDGWAWKEGSLRVNNKGETVATAIYTPADASNYATVEVEVVLASAGSSPSEPDVAPEAEPEGLGTGAIIGIVIGALLLLAIIVVVIAVARKKKKS